MSNVFEPTSSTEQIRSPPHGIEDVDGRSNIADSPLKCEMIPTSRDLYKGSNRIYLAYFSWSNRPLLTADKPSAVGELSAMQ